MEVQNLEIEDEAFRLDIVSPSVSREVRRGDVIQAGVRVEHAYTGERATTVMAFVVRLVCANGMVRRECVGSRENGAHPQARCRPAGRGTASTRTGPPSRGEDEARARGTA